MRNVVLALIGSSFLFSGSALAQTVTDVGEVVVDGDGNLSIGVDGFGSRSVDATGDGPYTSVTLGVNTGASGTLTLDNAASFSTPGPIGVGAGGSAVVEILSGSQLSSGSAALLSVPSRGELPELSQVVVSGQDSVWSNAGVLNFSGVSGSVHLLDGGQLYTDNVASTSNDRSRYSHEVVVEGNGSLLQNSGALSFIVERTSFDFVPKIAVRGGGVMIDSGASIRNFGPSSAPAVLVTGLGSRWVSGDINFVAAELRIENGGIVDAASLGLTTRESLSSGVVTGAGSSLNLTGTLSVLGGFATGFGVQDGAHVTSRGAIVNTTGGVRVSGIGSEWTNLGDMEISLARFGSPGEFSVTGGGRIFNQNANYLFCSPTNNPSCPGIEISGEGSLWHNSGNVSLNGPTSIRNGGTLFAGNRLDVLSGGSLGNGELHLDGGGVQTNTLLVDDGRLTGQGQIEGHVTNSGTVDPGDSETKITGTLSIDGTYSQQATGSLEILLTGSGVHLFDKVTVTGTVELAGELAISVGDGFATELGDRFAILEYGSRNGEFDQITGVQLGDGLSLRPVYTAEAMYLVTTPEPSTILLLGAGLGLLGALRNRN